MTNSISRRQFVGWSIAGAGIATLAGCSATGKGGSGSGSGSGTSSLDVSWYGGDPVHAAMKKVLALYGAKHAGVKISEQHSAFADYWDKLATETAARDAPDVMRMSMTYFTDYAERGALFDLTDFVGKSIDTSGMSTGVAKSGILHGKQYGIGQSSIANAIFINNELVDSLGVAKPDENWTWSSFADWSKSVGEAGGGKVFGSGDMGGHFEIFEPFARQHGTELFTSGGKSLAVSRDLIEEWWSYWADMRKAKAVPPASETASETGFDTSAVVKGVVPVTFGWVQQIQFLQPLMKQTLDLMVPPTVAGGKPGYYVDSQDMWSVASTSKNPDKAADLIDFMINDDAAIKALGVVLGVPPSKHATDVLALDPSTDAGKAVKYAQDLSTSDKASTPPAPWPKGYSQLSTLFTKTAQDISFGKSNPAQGATDFYGQAKQVLSQ